MINSKYLPSAIKAKLNHLSMDICEYRYSNQFTNDVIMNWFYRIIRKINEDSTLYPKYLNMIDSLTSLKSSQRLALRKHLMAQAVR